MSKREGMQQLVTARKPCRTFACEFRDEGLQMLLEGHTAGSVAERLHARSHRTRAAVGEWDMPGHSCEPRLTRFRGCRIVPPFSKSHNSEGLQAPQAGETVR